MRPLLALALFVSGVAHAGPTFHGPLPYLELADSPLDVSSPDFELEDFEDGTLDLPGTSWSHPTYSYLPSSSYWPDAVDSVDADDGAVDGICVDCDSLWVHSGALTFTFDEGALGQLPTEAGLVWTDGAGEVTFEAFDAEGDSLGAVVFDAGAGDDYFDDPSEDRFVGVAYAAGISAISIDQDEGTEIDHLQFGLGELDVDLDGLPDEEDLCEDTELDAAVDDDGCSVAQRVPCDDGWCNHGAYVREVAWTAWHFVHQGWLEREEAVDIISEAARSSCGR